MDAYFLDGGEMIHLMYDVDIIKIGITTVIKLAASNKQFASCNKQLLATNVYYNCQKTCELQQKGESMLMQSCHSVNVIWKKAVR
jgi:hypothetical protein